MKFDVDEPEVRRDIRRRSIAITMRLISRLLRSTLFKIFLWLSLFIFTLLFAAWCISRNHVVSIQSAFIGLALICVGYPLTIVCITKTFEYFSDMMISELVEKYITERDNFITSQFIELGFKRSHNNFSTIEFVFDNDDKYISIHEHSICYKYKLNEDYGKITISYMPVKSETKLNNRNILGIREFDTMFNVEWDDEVKARIYLTPTKILELLNAINDIKNFRDKKIIISQYQARFSYPRASLLKISNSHFPSIKAIIKEAKRHVFEASESFKIYDKYAYIIKK